MITSPVHNQLVYRLFVLTSTAFTPIPSSSLAARGGNLAKIPPNQVIDDFGRGISVESELKHAYFRKFMSDFIL